MPIGIDIRPLQDPIARGVSSYARPLIAEMARQQGASSFRLFAAGRKAVAASDWPGSEIRRLGWPSKAVNLGMRAFGSPTLDGQLGASRVFMPNLNFWSVGENAKLTVTVHDLSFLVDPTWYSLRERAWHRAIGVPALLRRADRILTLSRHTKREIAEMLDIEDGKISHVPPGIPQVAPGGEAPFPFPYVLFLGAVERRKNIAGALAAFRAAADRIPNTHFVLAGAGPGSWPMARGPWSSRVHFLGPVTPERKGQLLRHASALFLPSFYEGFGFPPLEAMSVGVPVVASSAAALPETVGSAGLLLDPLDTGGFADALVAACTDEDVRSKLINSGLERAKSFSWERCAAETWNALA